MFKVSSFLFFPFGLTIYLIETCILLIQWMLYLGVREQVWIWKKFYLSDLFLRMCWAWSRAAKRAVHHNDSEYERCFVEQTKDRWKEWFWNLETDGGNEENSKTGHFWTNDRPARGYEISGKTAFLLATDVLSTPQVPVFDHQDIRCRWREPWGRLPLSPQTIPWKSVFRKEIHGIWLFSIDLLLFEKSRAQDFLDEDGFWSCDSQSGREME